MIKERLNVASSISKYSKALEKAKVSLDTMESKVKSCTGCPLHATRTNTVFARGNENAKIIIVGESPGQHEDEQGIPFVGRSGNLLDSTLISLGLDLANDVYVCNIIKCRPPNNRAPTDKEVNSCLDFFEAQVRLVQAEVMVALGNTAVSSLINSTYGITKLRGKVFPLKRLKKIVVPTFHPSYILRNGGEGSETHKLFKQDLQLAISCIPNVEIV